MISELRLAPQLIDPSTARFLPLINDTAGLTAIVFTFVGVYAFTLAWLIVTWGGFRQLNLVTRRRSAIAVILLFLFSIPTTLVTLAAKVALDVSIY